MVGGLLPRPHPFLGGGCSLLCSSSSARSDPGLHGHVVYHPQEVLEAALVPPRLPPLHHILCEIKMHAHARTVYQIQLSLTEDHAFDTLDQNVLKVSCTHCCSSSYRQLSWLVHPEKTRGTSGSTFCRPVVSPNVLQLNSALALNPGSHRDGSRTWACLQHY